MTTTWRERIEAARRRGAFTTDDVRRAGSWTHCAVGEAIARGAISEARVNRDGWRYIVGDMVRHFILRRPSMGMIGLGCDFGGAVSNQDIAEAARILARIETRVLELTWGLTGATPSAVGQAPSDARARDPQGASGPTGC